jgi:hypothetical protein
LASRRGPSRLDIGSRSYASRSLSGSSWGAGYALDDKVVTAIADFQAAIDEGVGATTTMGAWETASVLVEAIVRTVR